MRWKIELRSHTTTTNFQYSFLTFCKCKHRFTSHESLKSLRSACRSYKLLIPLDQFPPPKPSFTYFKTYIRINLITFELLHRNVKIVYDVPIMNADFDNITYLLGYLTLPLTLSLSIPSLILFVSPPLFSDCGFLTINKQSLRA